MIMYEMHAIPIKKWFVSTIENKHNDYHPACVLRTGQGKSFKYFFVEFLFAFTSLLLLIECDVICLLCQVNRIFIGMKLMYLLSIIRNLWFIIAL